MTYTPVENRLGIQPIAQANPYSAGLQSGQSPFFNKEHPLGSIIRAYDPVYGEGEFIYLLMASTQAIGNLVTFAGWGTVSGDGSGNEAQFQAVLTTNTATQSRAVAVAMSAFPSGSPAAAFGWFQIKGAAVILSNGTAAAGSQPYLTNTANAGTITTSANAGLEIWNTRIIAAVGNPSGNFCVAQIDRPSLPGIIT
jgi:hypothetical protein